jgi:hypothetical protein
VTTINKVRAKPKPKAARTIGIMEQFKGAFELLKSADGTATFDMASAAYSKVLEELDRVLNENGGKENRQVYVHVLVAKIKAYRNWCGHLDWVAGNGKKRDFKSALIEENIQPLFDEIDPFTQGKRGLYTVVKFLSRQFGDIHFPSQPFKSTSDEAIDP